MFWSSVKVQAAKSEMQLFFAQTNAKNQTYQTRLFIYSICAALGRMEINMKFSDRLRALIEENGITQKQLAADLHIPVSTFGGYVQGTSEPDFQTLILIARYFNVTTDYLLDYRTSSIKSSNENELIRIFRSLSPEQQDLYLEQGKAFLKINSKEDAKSSKSTSQSGGKVG